MEKKTKPPPQWAIHKVLNEIDVLIRARYSLLYLVTHEETRIEELIADIAIKQGKQFYTWTATKGLSRYQEVKGDAQTPRVTPSEHRDPAEVLNYISDKNLAAVFLLKDFHPFLNDPLIVRRLRDVSNDLKSTYKSILISSPQVNLPIELEKEITLIDIPLPSTGELLELLKSVCVALGQNKAASVKLSNSDAWGLVRAARGLTLAEAENVFSKAAVFDSKLCRDDIKMVHEEKQQIIRKSGILEYINTEGSLSQIGGLENLKDWLKMRGKAFQPQAMEFGLPAPKGVLLLGAPGCGKSLTAKTVATAWEMPLLRLDFGKIFSGLVGSSEENVRRALKVAEGVAPAVLWIDEIEKGLAGGASGSGDSGTAARVFGTFLTWMQEKTSSVFVIATANRIDLLPPELLRRGRFDEIFFLDLPGDKTRKEILEIHLKKRKRDPSTLNLAPAIAATEGFSGAEIEHCIIEALFLAFDAGRELTAADIFEAAKKTVPLSVTYVEELTRLRAWAANRARPAELSEEASSGQGRIERLEVINGKKAV